MDFVEVAQVKFRFNQHCLHQIDARVLHSAELLVGSRKPGRFGVLLYSMAICRHMPTNGHEVVSYRHMGLYAYDVE